MPLIWAAITAHGFGHAAQVVPVLNALARLVPNVRVLLRTTVTPSFFHDRLVPPWTISPVQQDVGCVQNGPLSIDIEQTWQEHDRFHNRWHERLDIEVAAMRATAPDLVLADTPYLALAAGRAAALPSIALVSFTWDLILSEYHAPSTIDHRTILRTIRQAYAEADLALRITPSPPMEIFRRSIEIQPIAEPASSAREQLAKHLALTPGERTVLIGFGGIQLDSLPFDTLETLTGYRFLFDGPSPPHSTRFVSTTSLPFSFKTLLASVDLILTKPGYGTVIEAVALQIPMVYVRRYNFADEQPLVDYVHRYGRGIELSRDDFAQGRWEDVLQHAAQLPPHPDPTPPTSGADEAARHLAPYLIKKRG